MNIPQHVVIVPDGNRRWAKQKGRPTFFGHQKGAKTIEDIAEKALSLGIPYLTVWGSSVANVTERSSAEVRFLYKIFDQLFKKLIKNKTVHSKRIRIEVLGRWREFFPKSLQKTIEKSITATKDYNGHHLTLLMAYNGQDEMLSAVNSIKESAQKVSPELLKKNLWTKNLPSVDLVIRTGGEPHWSAGLMMWDVAEARLYFTETLWPDFSNEEFENAVYGFGKTERRYGK